MFVKIAYNTTSVPSFLKLGVYSAVHVYNSINRKYLLYYRQYAFKMHSIVYPNFIYLKCYTKDISLSINNNFTKIPSYILMTVFQKVRVRLATLYDTT